MQLFIFRTDSKCSVLEIVCLLSQILLNCCWEVVRGMKKQLSWIRSPRLLPAATCSQGWWELQVMPAYLKEYFFLFGIKQLLTCVLQSSQIYVFEVGGGEKKKSRCSWLDHREQDWNWRAERWWSQMCHWNKQDYKGATCLCFQV